MRVLVTGGAGFIGSNFVRYLLGATAHEVTTLDSLTYAGSLDNLADLPDESRHEFVEGDVRDEELVDELVDDADAVVNFAAESHVDRSIDDAAPFVSTNVGGTRTLLDAARRHDAERFVQLSTDEVYGEILDGAFAEGDPLEPRNPYAATKAGSDLLARSYHATYGLPVVVARPSNNFGPRQHPEKFVPKLLTRAAAGRSIPIYGDGSNVREWTYVRDCCRALYRLLEDGADGAAYNVGSGHELTNLEVARTVLDRVGASPDLLSFVEDRPGHDRRYALETERIRSLGWTPEWTFEEGLDATLDHYLE